MQNLVIVCYTTILSFSALYAPQPILPLLSAEFGVGPSQASLLITVTLLPLGVAPVAYGYILEALPAKTLLRRAVLLLALSELPFLLVDSFWALVAARLVQGLLLPAILTSLMTYLSTMTEPDRLKRTMSIYIAATILGGFLGRVLSGTIASYADWRITFLVLLIGLVVSYALLFRLEADAPARFARLSGNAIAAVLQDGAFRKGYLVIFLSFFTFASLLNLLPFRLLELDQTVSTFAIAMVYSGYLIGVVVALGSVALSRRLGGELGAIILALAMFLLAVVLFAVPNLPMVFVTMWVFCAGMFLVHSVLSGLLNHRASQRKGVVNGIYISSYYLGGTIGSYLPGYVYRHLGWEWYIASLAILVGLAIIIACSLKHNLSD